ncbi:hypothetical protein Q8F55_009250 [Vanrija albida]|uniref:Uncharacterized protein n=1 Tax=Vanrija albida TaxID=181172 RepID=A0ABR3PT43_9TREE
MSDTVVSAPASNRSEPGGGQEEGSDIVWAPWQLVPGIGLEVTHYGQAGNFNKPDGVFPTVSFMDDNERGDRYPWSVDYDEHLMGHWRSNTMVPSELSMLWFMNAITDKPEWARKVHDGQITNNWWAELQDFVAKAKEQAGDSYSYPDYNLKFGFGRKMWNYCLAELKEKAEILAKTGAVSICDGAAAAIKADGLVPPDVKAMLRAAAAKFENVPDSEKDWHPISEGRVLDLVHPSLFPLVYGTTRIVSDKPLNLSNALDAYGSGEVIEKDTGSAPFYSCDFQWLPAEVKFSARTGEVKFDSYINNAHPVHNADLYTAVEGVLKVALPLFRAVYERAISYPSLDYVAERTRVPCHECEEEIRNDYVPGHQPGVILEPRSIDETHDEFIARIEEATGIKVGSGKDIKGWCTTGDGNGGEADDGEDDDSEDSYSRYEGLSDWSWWAYDGEERTQPPPRKYEYSGLTADDMSLSKNNDHEPFRLAEFTGDDRWGNLQVVVKLANIHLTPEKPTYDGGSWHVEGLRNESICATALFYYDSDNVTASTLSFRTGIDAEIHKVNFSAPQGQHEAFQRLFGRHVYGAEWGATQQLGSVATIEDRLLVFPNVYQHKVSGFKLEDKTKPGHRKILALFLVDPATRIISTQHVPPQQRGWASFPGAEGRLPREVAIMVEKELDCPYSLEEAKKLRVKLMKERAANNKEINEGIKQDVEFNFCEH